VSATVTNVGSRAGSDVAQAYLADPAAAGEPPRQLVGFQRVWLAPGQSQRVSFAITPRDTWLPGRYQRDRGRGFVAALGRNAEDQMPPRPITNAAAQMTTTTSSTTTSRDDLTGERPGRRRASCRRERELMNSRDSGIAVSPSTSIQAHTDGHSQSAPSDGSRN
jgi:Fibronectin type III-like domain